MATAAETATPSEAPPVALGRVTPNRKPGEPLYALRSGPTIPHHDIRLAVTFDEPIVVGRVRTPSRGWKLFEVSVGGEVTRLPGTAGMPSEFLAMAPALNRAVPAGTELAVRARYVAGFPPKGELVLELMPPDPESVVRK